MPLSFGAILGGTTTLVGTPPNIVGSDLLGERGLAPFELFDFAPLGAILLGVGVLFMTTIGRRLLPTRQIGPVAGERDLADIYRIHDRLFCIRLPERSRLDGMSIRETRIGTTLGVKILAIVREGRRELAPNADTALRSGDVLMVTGRLSDLQKLLRAAGVEIVPTRVDEIRRYARGVNAIRIALPEGSPLAGRTLSDLRFREEYGVVVVGILREGEVIRGFLSREVLRDGDEILALGTREQVQELAGRPDFVARHVGLTAVRQLQEHLFLIRVPEGSPLAGTPIGESRIGEIVGLTVGGIIRGEEIRLAVPPDEVIQEGDRLVVSGEPSRIVSLLELGEIEIDPEVVEPKIESDEVGVVEVSIAPRSSVAGRTIADLRFQERYGLIVLSIWREGKPIHADLAGYDLRFGDALLLQGPWEKINRLAADPDFVVLSHAARPPRRTARAPLALAGLLLMIGMVITGFQPIHVAAFTAATLVLFGGALRMEDAYRAIEWRAIFLVAAVLPVGIAMERTGAARLLAGFVLEVAGPYGPVAILGSLIVLSSLLSQGLDGAPAVVLLTPVALDLATRMGVSPYPIMMGVCLAASAAFMTPFSHKANLLVMGAGGYRSFDYVRVGTPLTIALLVLLIVFVPIFFPF
jgi:di/tricarboxylate transporter